MIVRLSIFKWIKTCFKTKGDFLSKLLLEMKYTAFYHINSLGTLDIIMHNKMFNVINSSKLNYDLI